MDNPAPLNPVAQPKGMDYVLGTWSGRILLINSIVFAYICVRTSSLFMPDTATLLALGAKDPVHIAQGEFWRFLTPIFLHIGVIHFGFNSYFLYVVGYQLERLLGGPWFLAIYLLSGVAGNIASSVFSVNLSAGASSSLFGLLGAGLFLERTIGTHIKALTGQRPRNRAYAMTVVINLGLGLLIPFIDNSAHIGGLVAGTILTFAMLNLRSNKLMPVRPILGLAAIVLLASLCGVGAFLAASSTFMTRRLTAAAAQTDDPEERILHLSQALAIDPDNASARFERAKEFFRTGEDAYAFHDIRAIIAKGDLDLELGKLADELDANGHQASAWELRRMLSHAGEGL